MRNSRGRRLLGWMLCAGLALAMVLVLLPAQEAFATMHETDRCPSCGTGFIFCRIITQYQHAFYCINESCELHSNYIWEDHTVDGKHCGVSGKCEGCGFKFYIPHTGGADICTKQGICEYCGETYGPLGHDFSTDVSAKEATCTENGYTAHKKCSRCDAKNEAYQEIPRLGHDLKAVAKVNSTCTKAGSEAYWACNRDGCGKMFSDAEGKHEISKPAAIAAKGHKPAAAVKEKAKAPQAGKAGRYEKVVYCSVCKAELSRKTVNTYPLPLVTLPDGTGTAELRFFGTGGFTMRIRDLQAAHGRFFQEDGVLTLEADGVKMPVAEDGSLSFILGEENWSFIFPEDVLALLGSQR